MYLKAGAVDMASFSHLARWMTVMGQIHGIVFEPGDGVGELKTDDWDVDIRRSSGPDDEYAGTPNSTVARHHLANDDDVHENFRIIASHRRSDDVTMVVDLELDGTFRPSIALTSDRMLITCSTALLCVNGRNGSELWRVPKCWDVVYVAWPIERGDFLVIGECSFRRFSGVGECLWEFAKDMIAKWTIVDDRTAKLSHWNSPTYHLDLLTGKAAVVP